MLRKVGFVSSYWLCCDGLNYLCLSLSLSISLNFLFRCLKSFQTVKETENNSGVFTIDSTCIHCHTFPLILQNYHSLIIMASLTSYSFSSKSFSYWLLVAATLWGRLLNVQALLSFLYRAPCGSAMNVLLLGAFGEVLKDIEEFLYFLFGFGRFVECICCCFSVTVSGFW